MTILPNLQAIENQYESFFFDLWGVVHDGYNAFPGVVALINELIAKDKKILFLSNAPRPGLVLFQKLKDLGISLVPEMILSSGDIVRKQLMHFNDSVFKHLGKRFFHLGAERNKDILSGLNVDVTENLNEAEFVLLTAYMDEGEDLNRHDAFLIKALDLKLPFICANPDKDIDNGGKLRFCAGVLAEKYEKMGGSVYYYGKPFKALLESGIEILRNFGIVDQRKILMIGDTLETDILGASNVGIDSALVLTGNTARFLANAPEHLAKDEGFKPENSSLENYLQMIFKKVNIYPTWTLSRLY